MKRFLIITAAVLMIITNLTGCEYYLLTEEEATEGFAASFNAFFTVLLTYTVDTAEYQYDAFEDIYTYTDYDISYMGSDYTAVSGSAEGDGGNYYDISMQMEGGLVEIIQYRVTFEQMIAMINLEPVTFTFTANTFDYEVTFESE